MSTTEDTGKFYLSEILATSSNIIDARRRIAMKMNAPKELKPHHHQQQQSVSLSSSSRYDPIILKTSSSSSSSASSSSSLSSLSSSKKTSFPQRNINPWKQRSLDQKSKTRNSSIAVDDDDEVEVEIQEVTESFSYLSTDSEKSD